MDILTSRRLRCVLVAMLYAPWIAYIDETGNHGLDSVASRSPVFLLCAALYQTSDYLEYDLPALTKFKFDQFGHDNIVLHSHKIRNRLPPFQHLIDPVSRLRFMEAVADFFTEGSRCTLIAAAIDKARYFDQSAAPQDPYYLATKFVLERIWGHIKNTKPSPDAKIVCIFESRGLKEDKILSAWFAEICQGDNRWGILPFDIEFADKKTNMGGLQVADLAAYPIAKYVETQNAGRPDWQAVRNRIRSSPNGEILGWGLKIFP